VVATGPLRRPPAPEGTLSILRYSSEGVTATSDQRRPQPRRAASGRSWRDALIDAAAELFAESGPGAVSIRAVAERAGCSHTLVGRNFGSKAGLQQAVTERVARELDALADTVHTSGIWSAAEFLAGLRCDPNLTRLATRAALGEFDMAPLIEASTLGSRLVATIESQRGGDPKQLSPTARATAFFVLHTLLGYITFEPLLVFGTRSCDIPEAIRDTAMVEAVDLITALGCDPHRDLGWGPEPRVLPQRPSVVDPTLTAEDALIVATIDLYVERGPGRVTTRDIADRAQVNQGLIYHYFESLEDLTAKALTVAASPFAASAVTSDRFDLVRLARARPDLDFLVIIARQLLDGIDVTTLDVPTTVFDVILARYHEVPTGPGPGGLADPRLATMAASAYYQGTAVWDRLVRTSLDIPLTGDLSAAGITVVTALLDRPVTGEADTSTRW